MRVAAYTLTRDRLDYTVRTLAGLRAKAGVPFDHYVVDNGSEDGTPSWLRANADQFKRIIFNPKNAGISVASNQALDAIAADGGAEIVLKCDNDVDFVSENIIGQLVEIYESLPKWAARWVLSPATTGLMRQSERVRYVSLPRLGGRKVGVTAMVGGLFQAVPAEVALGFRYDTAMPLAFGQDSAFCAWARFHGCECGYVEGLVVEHMDTTAGQATKYPEYFNRKYREEKP